MTLVISSRKLGFRTPKVIDASNLCKSHAEHHESSRFQPFGEPCRMSRQAASREILCISPKGSDAHDLGASPSSVDISCLSAASQALNASPTGRGPSRRASSLPGSAASAGPQGARGDLSAPSLAPATWPHALGGGKKALKNIDEFPNPPKHLLQVPSYI